MGGANTLAMRRGHFEGQGQKKSKELIEKLLKFNSSIFLIGPHPKRWSCRVAAGSAATFACKADKESAQAAAAQDGVELESGLRGVWRESEPNGKMVDRGLMELEWGNWRPAREYLGCA